MADPSTPTAHIATQTPTTARSKKGTEQTRVKAMTEEVLVSMPFVRLAALTNDSVENTISMSRGMFKSLVD